jgi:hypothetical protein
VLVLAGVLTLAGAWGLRRLGALPSDVTAALEEVAQAQHHVAEQREQLHGLEQQIAAQIEQETVQLGQREQALTKKFLVFREWMEFPEPIDLSRPPPREEPLPELAQKDRQLLELLQRESERVFEDILQNKYAPDGQFRVLVARDDVVDLIRRVARIYRPEAENPLLETNLERVFRAASRACLQFLVVLEQLPLSVPRHDLNSLYGYVRQAVKAYGMYRNAEPYFPYLSGAYSLGRLALGASPISLGTWWLARQVGTKVAKDWMTRLVNRQALQLLHSVVRVIGFEVASLYSDSFRWRDANWIYAAEVTELASSLPLSRAGLALALKELGAIQLRNEYDRVFLYRCLAEHRSAQPERYRATDVLTTEERQLVAGRLERLLQTAFRDWRPKRLQRWQAGVEERLAVKLAVGGLAPPRAEEDQVQEGLRALASFLLELKALEPDQLPTWLGTTQLAARATEEQRSRWWLQWQQNPPFFFQPPDLDHGSKLVGPYLDDLATLAVRVPPYQVADEEVLAEVAGYLRQDRKSLQERLQREYVRFLDARLPAEAPGRNLPPDAARAVLGLLADDEQPQFVYPTVTFPQAQESVLRGCAKSKTWLLGTSTRLVAFSVADVPTLLWEGDAAVSVSRVRGYLIDDCELTGGRWLATESSAPPVVRVAGAALAKYPVYFARLLKQASSEGRDA